jgi:hypothetical protein
MNLRNGGIKRERNLHHFGVAGAFLFLVSGFFFLILIVF